MRPQPGYQTERVTVRRGMELAEKRCKQTEKKTEKGAK
jgi:hypothetical protein